MKIAIATCLFAVIRALLLPLLFAIRGAEYQLRNAIAEDQAWNSLLGGHPDETISARAHRAKWPRAEPFINRVFDDSTHCESAFQAEMSRSQLPSEYHPTNPASNQ